MTLDALVRPLHTVAAKEKENSRLPGCCSSLPLLVRQYALNVSFLHNLSLCSGDLIQRLSAQVIHHAGQALARVVDDRQQRLTLATKKPSRRKAKR